MEGNLSYFLGFQIKQLDDGIFLFQNKYANNLVKKFGLENEKPKKSPLGETGKLNRNDAGVSVDNTVYRSMIGSLLYLTASRPDIMYSVCLCARYQANPKESHMKVVKRIIKYVAGTSELGLWYTKDTCTELVGYTDSDWADYGLHSSILTILCDNTSAIDISKNLVQHSRIKHIDIMYHFIRDLVERKIVSLEHVGTDDQLADIFTKALDYETFSRLRRHIGMTSPKRTPELSVGDRNPLAEVVRNLPRVGGLDIRVEIGGALPQDPSAVPSPSPSTELVTVPVADEAPLMAQLFPGQAGNEIDVDNPPDLPLYAYLFGRIGNPSLKRSRRLRNIPPGIVPPAVPKIQAGPRRQVPLEQMNFREYVTVLIALVQKQHSRTEHPGSSRRATRPAICLPLRLPLPPIQTPTLIPPSFQPPRPILPPASAAAVRSQDPVPIRDAQLKILERRRIRKSGDSTAATDSRRHTTAHSFSREAARKIRERSKMFQKPPLPSPVRGVSASPIIKTFLPAAQKFMRNAIAKSSQTIYESLRASYRSGSPGEMVAVEVLVTDSKQGEKEFQTEVMLLARLHHRNLVNLVGYCAEKSQHMLIYVYMIRGSLASHLYSKFSSCLEAFPHGGDCSGLVVIYEQCVRTFWHEDRYKDDLRYLKAGALMIVSLLAQKAALATNLQSVESILKKTVTVLNEIRDVSEILSGLTKDFNIDKFLAVFLDSLLEHSATDDQCSHTLLSIIEIVPIKDYVRSQGKQILVSIYEKYPNESQEAFFGFLKAEIRRSAVLDLDVANILREKTAGSKDGTNPSTL
ncbi:uncharacterized mitochondrial protein atmg00810 [Phtheirospermum japonicum]|uniref:Uncharacterized mitochondrial protein atmg00810 n=1 Tax=Phtheirospermum japonicum TaxID=374723 RepID=A0A830D212_9LAMI|nr:uncharacterized mitochondrial protein atmg00810 [Phtheirospermum japonicum]